MNSVIVMPEAFIQQLKDSLIPDLREQLSREFQPKQPTEYLTIQDVCDLLQVSKPTIWRWKTDGILPSYGMGTRVYFKRSEIDEIMNKNKIN